MKHDALGYWLREAGARAPLPALDGGRLDVDVVIVGGGYTGMWSAWHLLEAEPSAKVAVLEADRFGNGPSGRNGGFVNSLWPSIETMRERYGAGPALAVARESEDSVDAVGRVCSEQGVDAWYRKAGLIQVSAAPAQDATVAATVASLRSGGSEAGFRELTAAEVAERCSSPRFRGGVHFADAATVQPARLALGLRERLLDRGALMFERAPVRAIRESAAGVEAVTPAGTVFAPSAVLAIGGGLASSGSPLRNRLTVTSSHMVITEPVPDVLEEIGWTGGESVYDSRAMVHYLRTTPDGRIAFGWGGGRLVCGARLGGRAERDGEIVAQVAKDLRAFFPALADRDVEHAWGGPIDVSPAHLPTVTASPGGRAYAAFGYTGNGVGPSQMIGRTLASLALDRRDERSRLAFVEPEPARVPPEPLRWLGGTAIRSGLLRKERAEEDGREAGAISRALAAVPELIGFHVGR